MAVGDLYKFVMQYGSATGTVAQNVQFLLIQSVVGTEVTVAQMLAALETAFKPNVIAALSIQASLSEITLQKWDEANNVPLFDLQARAITSANVGELTGDALPYQCAGGITFRTGIPGRSTRGRIYFPFPSESETDTDGLPSGAYLALLVGVATTYLTPVAVTSGGNTTTLRHVVYSPTLGGSNVSLNATVRETYHTQRRRRLGVGI